MLLFLLSYCPDNKTNNNLPDPLKENPESDAIPKDMKVKNDSVLVPDTARVDSLLMQDTTNMNH